MLKKPYSFRGKRAPEKKGEIIRECFENHFSPYKTEWKRGAAVIEICTKYSFVSETGKYIFDVWEAGFFRKLRINRI
jgi:hypothetical protein